MLIFTSQLFLAYVSTAALGNMVLPEISRFSQHNNGFLDLQFNKLYGTSFDIAKKWQDINLGQHNLNFKQSELYKRASSDYQELEIKNQQSFYSLDLFIGTPGQNVTVQIDTGSSDLWVTGSNNPYCNGSTFSDTVPSRELFNCSQYGTFNTNKSSTWSSNNSRFFIQYGDTTFASGTWGRDVMSINGLNVTGLTFAVANASNSSNSVLGIGLTQLETTYNGSNSSHSYTYANFPVVLKNAGLTESISYSLFLNELDAESGSILFGAVDHSKYSGNLYTLPLVNTYKDRGFPNPIEFAVTLQGIGIVSGSKKTTITQTKLAAILDSGTSLTVLPGTIIHSIASSLNGRYSPLIDSYLVSCSLRNSTNTNLVFDFGGFTIKGTLSNFILEIEDDICILGLSSVDENSVILGDTFLASAYVVYDLENLQISMAQAKFDNSTSDIDVIRGNSGVPSAIKAPGYSSTWTATPSSISTGGNIFPTVTSRSSTQTSTHKGNSDASTTSSTQTKKNYGNRENPRILSSIYFLPIINLILDPLFDGL
ncbi:hypothetical protein KAFR_0B06530 [Kazachstania africana CBS 2517]|uniref:Peptidase A1 domain-containing protein n=1 Tax=Kazachstania africana (strain ATCC 22294 / BCRC 22015 / CBS 2517 / CECT 1963 / NBRC 1671 / NRRL Y-8276) TaxID=1071382 RepID=H2ARE9_KAZAF|nr:hypothetical protein KAFR_0B06530 [Kazachstania africana CBS 2517]CCF56949.1 hypothetical protein KAFR_0B06530 [Kazachstania africana CBS 2517]